MPRVHTSTKSAAGRVYTCGACGKHITKGQKFHAWSFRFGGSHRQHAECGYPRRGQLTQSKLGVLYDAQDAATEAVEQTDQLSDLNDALQQVADTAREIAEEYREAVQAMNMEGNGTENEERADTLDEYADALESVAGDIDGNDEWEAAEPEEGADADAEPLDEDGQTRDEWFDEYRQQALDAISDCDL
jgi:hypothetical protein